MSNYSKNFWHPMAHPADTKKRTPVHIVSGDGVYVTDDQGRKLLDGNAGGLWCVNVGHNQPEMKAAIMKQLEELVYYQLFDSISHPRATELAAKLVEMTEPENMTRTFFTSGGSDSVETALKLARQYHVLNDEADRKKFISLRKGYHGTHFGGASVGGVDMGICRRPYEPLLGNCITLDAPWLYRNPWHTDDPEELVRYCREQLIAEITFQTPDTIAALIAEPVMGGSLIVPPASYWPMLREVCDEYGILLIADEVVTGFGRSGSLFGSRGWSVAPDMMTLAKGISSGYIPLGAVMINERMAGVWEEAGSNPNAMISVGVTYAGHPVACAAGIAALNIVEKEGLPENARVQGDYLLERLKPFSERFPSVGDVRGKGLMITLDLVVDKTTREPIDPAQGFAYEIARVGRDNGIMVRPYGPRIIISPPLVFTSEHCDELADALEKTLSAVDK